MNTVIEVHFLSCLLMLGPPGRDIGGYKQNVITWWEDHVGTAGSHWYADWYVKWFFQQRRKVTQGV